MTFSRRFYYLIGGLVALPVSLFALTALYISVNSDVIKEKLLSEINAGTGANASIKGAVELSFLRHFPDVALEMKGVKVQGSVDTLAYPLLQADRVYFLANLWDVVSGAWKIKSTSIENGEFSMLRTKNGVVNYQFKKNDQDTAQNTSFSIDVEKAVLKNLRYRLVDEIAEVVIDIQIDDAAVNGNFNAENLALHTDADVFAHSVQIKGIDYADEKQVGISGSLAVVTDKGNYALNVERFMVGKNEFAINGNITMEDGSPVFDLAVRGKNVAVKDIPSLLPAAFAAKLDGIKGTGNLQITAEIKGKLDKKRNPAVTMSGAVSRATLQIPGMEGKISNLSFKGTFTNGSKQRLSSSVLTVSALNAKVKQGAVEGGFILTNFDAPHLKLNIDGVVDLSIMNKFLANDSRLKEVGGMLDFKNVTYSGRIEDLAAMRLVGIEGAVSARDVGMLIGQQKIEVPQANLTAYHKTLTIEKLELKFPESNISLSGKIDQMPALTGGKGAGVPNAQLVLRTESINVKEVLALLNNDRNETKKSGAQGAFNFLGNVKVQATHVGYNKFNAYDASGNVVLNGNVIELKDFSCNTVDGTLDFSSTIKIQSEKFVTKTHVQGSGMNLNEMFAQFEDFGQTTVTHKHISGKLTFTADINADFVDGVLDESKLSGVADITVRKGELVNMKSLESLSRFIDIEDLRHIKFETLKNKITISNKTVFIPEMLVESNAINIALSGSQTFSGAIDYNVKLNLFDVIGNKIRKRKDLTEYEEAGENNFNFYLSLTGTTENPSVKYARRGLKDRMAHQKEEIKNLDRHESAEEEIKTDRSPGGFKEKTIFTNKRKEQKPEETEEEEFIEWDDPD